MQSYIHPDFNIAFTRHLSLFFEIDYTHFSYCIYNASSGEISVIKKIVFNQQSEMQFDFEKFQIAVNKEDTLHCPYHEQHAAIAWSPFTVVPAQLFDSNNVNKYLDFICNDDVDSASNFEFAESLDMYIVFTLHHKLRYFFEKVQPKVIWHHAILPFMFSNKTIVESTDSDQVFLDVKDGYYFLTLFRNTKLVFINRFNFSNADDFMYYLLLACEQKSFDRNTLKLNISGELIQDSLIYKEIYKFFMHISFNQNHGNLQIPVDLEIPFHTFYTLSGLQLCESFQAI
ncbi:MAG: DUF3822 family protein [Chitinophagales bacterium]|nr:DUF3822 family protein [Chitinophagales bacterium]MBP9704549.1 DUF3822 family protein [Chitinophagales bacterium]